MSLKCQKTASIVGLGQIGLPLAVLSAMSGLGVFGVDASKNRLQAINKFDENSIEADVLFLLKGDVVRENLKLSHYLSQKSDYIIFAVPTPFYPDTNVINLNILTGAITDSLKFFTQGVVVILESTVPVGYTNFISRKINFLTGLECGKDFFLAYSPERLLPGNAIKELLSNERIVGGVTDICSQKAADFYEQILTAPISKTTSMIAEATKVFENSFRLLNIAFANEVYNFSKSLEIDPFELITLANKHPRVNIHAPGIGVGGDCLPVHPYLLPYLPSSIQLALEINKNQEDVILGEILNAVNNLQQDCAKILALGITYKPDVRDLRNSPALNICKKLNQTPCVDLFVRDPFFSIEEVSSLGLKGDSGQDFLEFDLVVILVGHTLFFENKNKLMSQAKKILDPVLILGIT